MATLSVVNIIYCFQLEGFLTNSKHNLETIVTNAFTSGGSRITQSIIWQNLFQKQHGNKRNWTQGRRSLASHTPPPLDPPLYSCYVLSVLNFTFARLPLLDSTVQDIVFQDYEPASCCTLQDGHTVLTNP